MTGNPGDNARFKWDLSGTGDYFKLNSVVLNDEEIYQFEVNPNAFLKPSGGSTSPCNTYSDGKYLHTLWRLIPEDDLIDGVQYYTVQSWFRPARFLYFNPDQSILSTREVGEDGPAFDASRKHFRVALKSPSGPALSVSATGLAFSSTFLTKTITVAATNLTDDIVFDVPPGITLSGANVANNRIPAAAANAVNTVTLTADSDTGIEGLLTITSGTVPARTITLKSGVKQGVWYNIQLYHASLFLFISDENTNTQLPAVQELSEGDLTQIFTFIPVQGKNETFHLKNAAGKYLCGNDYGDTYYSSAITDPLDAEWTLDIRNGNTVIDYFDAFTIMAGSRLANRELASNSYLALASGSAPNVALACRAERSDSRGTFKVIATNYSTGISAVKAKALVYTNANRQIVVSGKAAAVASVYNMLGQKVAEKAFDTSGAVIDAPGAGIYLVTISSNGVIESHKVLLK
jgi:hypothetical protein